MSFFIFQVLYLQQLFLYISYVCTVKNGRQHFFVVELMNIFTCTKETHETRIINTRNQSKQLSRFRLQLTQSAVGAEKSSKSTPQ